MGLIEELGTRSSKKMKFKVSSIKEYYHNDQNVKFLFLSSLLSNMCLLMKEKDFDDLGLGPDSIVFLRKLQHIDTVNDVPVFKADQSVQISVSVSKTQMRTRVASFEADIINDIMVNSPTLVTFLFENGTPAAEDPMKPILSFYEFVGKKPESITNEEHVEVVVLDFYFVMVQEGLKAYLKIFVASRDATLISTLLVWLESSAEIDAMKCDHRLCKNAVWKIKADKLRLKVCPPISGSQRGITNNHVKKSRRIAESFISFKYSEKIKNEELLRVSSSLELKRHFFDDLSLIQKTGSLTLTELSELLRFRTNQEEIDSPSPGNAAFYLCEVENVGSEGNELTGFVYTDKKKVDAKFFLMPDVLKQTNLVIKAQNRYLLLVPSMEDAIAPGFQGTMTIKIEFMIDVDEETLEDLELADLTEPVNKKRDLEEANPTEGTSKSHKK